MQPIPGIVENGHIHLLQPVPAEDGTSVLVFILPRQIATSESESLFGKWKWFTDEMEQEVSHAWQRWTEKANSL